MAKQPLNQTIYISGPAKLEQVAYTTVFCLLHHCLRTKADISPDKGRAGSFGQAFYQVEEPRPAYFPAV